MTGPADAEAPGGRPEGVLAQDGAPDERSPALPRATGTGAWPGEDPLEAVRTVVGELSGEHGLPFAPELPARGPGADPTGRTAALLVDLPVDLQPVGWRLVDHPGRDARRAAAFRSADLDALAEAADGWTGPLKVGVLGPWSLAASLWLPRGERAVVDDGAARDLLGSLAEGAVGLVRDVQRLLPGAQVVVQVDEPSLPAVLAGRLPTASGWGRLPAVDGQRAADGLRDLVAALGAAGARVAVRCADPAAPLELLRGVGASALAVSAPASRPLPAAAWEQLAEAVESGHELWLGVLDAAAVAAGQDLPATGALLDAVRAPWGRLGLDAAGLGRVVLTPSTGLAALPPARARAVLGRLVEAAGALAEVAAEG